MSHYSKYCTCKQCRPKLMDDEATWEIIGDILFVILLLPGSYYFCVLLDAIIRRVWP